jgi:hypothetical protein
LVQNDLILKNNAFDTEKEGVKKQRVGKYKKVAHILAITYERDESVYQKQENVLEVHTT